MNQEKIPDQNQAQGEEEVSFELGDQIFIEGGRHDKLHGRIYYLDEELIRILPDGVSDRLVDVPLVEGDLDPSLGIEAFYSVTKRTNPAFVAQIDAHVGLRAEAFTAEGQEGGVFTIKAINEKEDTILLEDDTGADLSVEFNFRGIPRDLPFSVLRVRAPSEEARGPAEEEEVAEEAAAIALEGEEEDEFKDVLEEELAATAAPAGLEIIDIPASEQFFSDSIQRTDLLQDLLAAMDAASKKNPQKQKEVRSLVEQCISLRNSLVEYAYTGEPTGQKATSYQTLGELLERGHTIPLSRPVVDAKRVLYLDHSTEGLQRMAQGGVGGDPREVPGANVEIQYLDESVKGAAEYMETQLGGVSSQPLGAGSLPSWYLSWNTLHKQFHSTWVPNTEVDTKGFAADKEFLRAPLPDPDGSPGVDALKAIGSSEKAIVSAEFVGKTSIGLQRALGPRYQRLNPKEPVRRIEAGEEAAVVNTLVFPLSEQRNLGATRSGNLAKDISLSHQFPQSLKDILERLDGIPDVATAGGILSVGPDGNTQGNIPIDEWLKVQPLYPLGLADVLVDLANYGLGNVEFNVEQYEALISRMDTYRALIKQYILELRDLSTKALSQLHSEANPFLQPEAAEDVLAVLQTEPLLTERMEEIKKRLPAYKDTDLALFAGLWATSADLVVTALAQVPGPLARERNRKVRDQFLATLRDGLARADKKANAGEAPAPNRCEHVAGYIAVQKVKDDGQRMQLLARFLAKFKGVREGNWIKCGVCSENLMCYHEVLQLQEFLHPREKEILHKELLLAFSGGQFHGRFMCRNCGQGISELEFDTNLEFSDDGAPMMGRAVLDTKEEQEDDELEEALGPSVGTEEELEFKTDTQTMIYGAARKLFDTLGIQPVVAAYQRIVARVESEILKQPSRADYQAMTKGRKAVDYDIIISRVLVCALAVHTLVEIQTNIPGYVVRYRIPGARAGFSGYPTGNEKDRTGIEYVAFAVSVIKENAAPWNLTGFQREGNEKKRLEMIVATMDKMMASAVGNSGVQQQIRSKREYVEKTYGAAAVAEQLPEEIPSGFLPVPYKISEEEVKKEAIVPAAATAAQSVRAWILQAHTIAKESGTYVRGNPFVEAMCCATPIQEPGAFWREKVAAMATLPTKLPPRGPVRGHVGVHFKARPQQRLEAIISPEVMYRIFLKVCYEGPNKGLPHEPGYTNTCIHCGFTFPESPYVPKPIPPMSSDSKTQKEQMKEYMEEVDAIITKGKVALETQKVEINERSFAELVDTTHIKFRVDIPKRVAPETGMRLLNELRGLNPPPFEGWRELLEATMERLAKLPPGAEELDIADAYGPMSNAATEILDDFRGRLGSENTAALKAALESGPASATESIWSYILLPFQRLISGFETTNLKVQKAYKLGMAAEEDNNRLLVEHLQYLAPLKKRATGFTLHKMKWARDRLVQAIAILKRSIRGSLIPGGAIGLPYLVTALLGGILMEFMNPNHVPPGGGEEAAAVDTGARAPIQILDVCVQKLRLEGLNFTPDQIRDMINRRNDIEKTSFINRFDRLTPEQKRIELMKKRLGLGEWAVGGTKAIYAHNPDMYERERVQRLDMGFQDFMGGTGDVTLPGPEGDWRAEADGAYDTAQMREDEY